MPTITEMPKVTGPKPALEKAVTQLRPEVPAVPVAREYKPLFSDSLIGGTGAELKRKTATTTFSFIFQCVLLGIMALLPLMFTEALPKGQLLTFLVAPPPPPPPPPPAAPAVKVVRETDVLNSGALRTPTRIPKKIEMIKEEDTPPSQTSGVVGGIPGGVPGGQLGGVIGGIIGSTSSITAVPKLEPVKRIRVSQGVTQGLLVHKVEPQYPKIALAARITGVVQLHAVISKDGNIKELQALSGPPLLIPSAIDAVKQWRYRPYLLNGEAVEVETSVTVTFQLSGAS